MAAEKFSVALLYSGRWFGAGGHHLADNHIQWLIRPNLAATSRLDIYVVVPEDAWCSRQNTQAMGTKAILAGEVASAWAAVSPQVRVHSHLFGLPNVTGIWQKGQKAAATNGMRGDASPYKLEKLVMWARQFQAVASTVHLMRRTRGDYDVVVRARIDVSFIEPVLLTPLRLQLEANPRLVFATHTVPPGVNKTTGFGLPEWREWTMVMAMPGAHALARMTAHDRPAQHDHSKRCYGFCMEEQTMLQLEVAGMTLKGLLWRLRLVRMHHNASAAGEDLDAKLERFSLLRRDAGAAHCYQHAQMFAAKMRTSGVLQDAGAQSVLREYLRTANWDPPLKQNYLGWNAGELPPYD